MPRTIIESFAKGTPVVPWNLGAMSSMIEHKRTGWLFEAGDTEELEKQLVWIAEHRDELAPMRQVCRAEYERLYTGEASYGKLMQIFEKAGVKAPHGT